jgi:hypothetical protein
MTEEDPASETSSNLNVYEMTANLQHNCVIKSTSLSQSVEDHKFAGDQANPRRKPAF